MMDPLSLYEMAHRHRKSVRELTTGEPGMSNYELCVMWPAYFSVTHEMREEEAMSGESLDNVIDS